ncbi:MAG: hypothetical protein C0397_02545 [Odoribacter sp.]|nr:hypothetical protein [Odoribacter sp.]
MEYFLNFYTGFAALLGLIYSSPWGRKYFVKKSFLKKHIKKMDFAVLAISIIVIVLGVVDNYNKEEYQGVNIVPTYSIVPGGASQEYSVVVTNNCPYPVFNLTVFARVKEGNLNMENCQLVPEKTPEKGNSDIPIIFLGLSGPRFQSLMIKEIEARSSYKIIMKIRADKLKGISKIGYDVTYHKEPFPIISFPIKPNKDGKYELPKTFKLPDGFEKIIPK